MKDYWSKLKLNECWSEKERFNLLMNTILGDTEESTEEPVIEPVEELSNISVSITDNENNGVNNANVILSKDETSFSGTTGKLGGCTIKDVPFGEYSITVTAEGYQEYTGTVTINQVESTVDVSLTNEIVDENTS